VNRTELSPVNLLSRAVAMFADRTAVVSDNRRYTYREFALRVRRLATNLRAEGVGRGVRVAVLSPNTPAMIEAQFAIPAIGGVIVNINTRLTGSEIDYILEHSGATLLLADAQFQDTLDQVSFERSRIRWIADTGEPDDPYEALLLQSASGPLAELSPPALEEDPIAINYTSGTTGPPKGVVHTHRHAYLGAVGQIIESGMGYDSAILWSLPIFHAHGWGYVWSLTAMGGKHVCLRTVDYGRIWSLLEAEGVTHHNGAPIVHSSLAFHENAKRLSRTVTAMVSGAPPSPRLFVRLRELNFLPIHIYGLTETNSTSVCAWQPQWRDLEPTEQARLLSRQGQAFVVADPLRVLDSDKRDVPRDGATVGEVVMRGNLVMKEYHDEPDATAAAFEGGWLHSGDLAVVHPDGYIELRDRMKDIIVSGGENISSVEVEQALLSHPCVSEAAVVASPSEKWGERPVAFVVLSDPSPLPATLLTFCRSRLAHFKCPDSIHVVDDLPKTSTGKIRKLVLREPLWNGYDRNIQ
jgi:fatty-acyl-CoA synthase